MHPPNQFLFPSFISPASHGNHAILPCRYPTQTKMDQCHNQRCSVLQRLTNDPFYGLTDDGDFAILGVNAEEPANDANINDGSQYLSSLLSATSFSGLSDEGMKSQSAGGSTQSPSASATAGFGVGDAISLNDALFGRLPSNGMGSDALSDATQEDTLRSIFGNAEESMKMKSTNNHVDEESLSEIEDWLLAIIPKLNENEIESYAQGLSGIGFHPDCVTMCELKYEDLDFMKALHRRYLFNEVTGIEHPWEP